MSIHDSPLILASDSAARAKLLKNSGLTFQIQSASIDERLIQAGLSAGSYVTDTAIALAKAKAEAVSQLMSDAIVIGADQILSCQGKIIHKAPSYDALRDKLWRLSGKTHVLTSAVAVAQGGQSLWDHYDEARLSMRPLSEKFIEDYMTRAGPDIMRSVGGYHLEGLGIQLFDAIEGDYFTILGLPLLPLLHWLRVQNIIPQ